MSAARRPRRCHAYPAALGWGRSVLGSATTDDLDEAVLLSVLSDLKSGDFTARMPVHWTGTAGRVAATLNDIVIANQTLGLELARVSRVVGKEGKLSQRVAVHGSDRVWLESIDAVNSLIGDLVRPTSEMQRVIGAVADGDLGKKITADVHGEVLHLKETINAMVDQLNRFASEVTRVAREVGVEGKLGGQAQSAEVGGVWKDLTDNVNQLAANLTNQVRAIADVATAVTDGDLTRQVGVEASGEVAVLKDKLNEMIRNLRETTRQNTEQDWLKTNLERFARMLQGQRDLATVSSMILSELAPLVSAQHGVFYTLAGLGDGGEPVLLYQAGYGFKERKHLATHFRLGEGLVGQCAQEKERILLTEVPGDYIRINSGLGEAPPLNIIVLPILFEGAVRAVVELASFSHFSPTHQVFLDRLTESIGLVLNTIEANTITENLLEQSQSQAHQLQTRQEELSRSNENLGRQASRLAEQNSEVERKNQEVELAKRLVEEKVEQLAVSSMYKSEFFSNMSHELRTPLNSLLILAGELESNPEQNLTAGQVEYASVIRTSGNDLLRLLDDILDLAKVESGTVTLRISELPLRELQAAIERDFGHVAAHQGLSFAVELAAGVPPSISTDADRLRQVLKNFLSNAFKFTEQGHVSMRMSLAEDGWSRANDKLRRADSVIAFAVSDSGIGVTPEKQQLIFEAFAQADGGTARQYGGTGLGLSISRELVRLLGGEITLSSSLGEGSTFTLYLPCTPTVEGEPPPVATGAPTLPSPRLPALVSPPLNGATGSAPTPQPPTARVVPEHSENAGMAGLTVLVVDDDSRNVFALTALLQRFDLEVIAAESGEQGVAVLEQTPKVALVLVDIMMPGMDGYGTMRAMRSLPTSRDLPLIAFTAKVSEDERRRCTDAGASAYVSKPVDVAELLLVLTEWLPVGVPAGAAGNAVG
jgi:signal transduction histidine kinase/CheY-like chemotaxis protein/HAMP domain-containing protein